MSTHGLRTAHSIAAVWLLLLSAVACVEEGSSRSPGELSTEAAPSAETADEGGQVRETADAWPAPCPSEPKRLQRLGETVTHRLPVYGTLDDVFVSRTGTATIAWTVSLDAGEIRTLDVPPGPGDPQSPAGPSDPEHRQVFSGSGLHDVLAADAAGVQTLVWFSDGLGYTGGPSHFNEIFEVTVADRGPSGGAWSSLPAVLGAGFVSGHALGVNPSGAAVVAWSQFEGRRQRLYASYRPTAGAGWGPAELVAEDASLQEAGIDDAGRVVLLFSRGNNARERLYAVRRTVEGGWGSPEGLPGGGFLGHDLAVSADGSAVVLRDRTGYEGDPVPGSQFTVRMTPSGRWQSPARHPAPTDGFFWNPVGTDAKGRALLGWWDGGDLLVRWSRPDGEWRQPCILAPNVTRPRSVNPDAQLAVNRRGDALVVWAARGEEPQLRARYKRAGQRWTAPMNVTREGSPPDAFTIALGEGGHAAVGWMPRSGRQFHVVRAALADTDSGGRG